VLELLISGRAVASILEPREESSLSNVEDHSSIFEAYANSFEAVHLMEPRERIHFEKETSQTPAANTTESSMVHFDADREKTSEQQDALELSGESRHQGSSYLLSMRRVVEPGI